MAVQAQPMHLDSVDARFTIAAFVDSLADLYHPKHCAQYHIGCLTILFGYPMRGYDDLAFRAANVAFFDACSRFITAPRSEDDHLRFEKQMRECSCDLTNEQSRTIHQYGSWSEPCTASQFSWMLVCILYHVLLSVRADDRLHKVEKNRRRAARQGTTVPWPRSPQDVLPHGISASINALAIWTKYGLADTIYLSLIANILGLFKTALIPALLASPSLPGIFVELANLPLSALLGHAPMPRGGRGTLLQWVQHVDFLYYTLQHHFDPDELRALCERAAAQVSDARQDFPYICYKVELLLPGVAAHVEPGAKTQLAMCLRNFRIYGTLFLAAMDPPYDPERYDPQMMQDAWIAQRGTTDIYFQVHAAFVRLAAVGQCWAPGCRATTATAQRSFARCKGCKRVRYCSQRCQAQGWKHDDVPHKAVCKAIASIAEKTGLKPKSHSEDALAFKASCEVGQVDPKELAEFGEHMTKLQKYLTLA
ncbi:zinc finger MYND domain-containing protein [Phanerochaete sordida]|uniref:Zinc finger MYND domain-containing protein n=1 Tax=Phanerochaete sordida TaxID=48140 RepID=A0A9P3GNX1_9APHY|nr:zinc finger MYND domain-containing protein [Phanerochaete sordida]